LKLVNTAQTVSVYSVFRTSGAYYFASQRNRKFYSSPTWRHRIDERPRGDSHTTRPWRAGRVTWECGLLNTSPSPDTKAITMAQAKKSSGSASPYTESAQQFGEEASPPETDETRPTRAHRAVEEVQQTRAEIAPQLGTVAAVAVATALIEAELLPAVLIGAGAALLPRLLPGAGPVLRPVLKTVIRAGYSAFTTAQQWAAEAREQVQDIVAEVQSEQRSAQRRAAADTKERASPMTGAEGS
jgi:Protein of unknown function (DUF5132)